MTATPQPGQPGAKTGFSGFVSSIGDRAQAFVSNVFSILDQFVLTVKENASTPKSLFVAVLFIGISVDLILAMFGVQLGFVTKLTETFKSLGLDLAAVLKAGGWPIVIVVYLLLERSNKSA